jgi:hypothetical protein
MNISIRRIGDRPTTPRQEPALVARSAYNLGDNTPFIVSGDAGLTRPLASRNAGGRDVLLSIPVWRDA